MVIIFVGSCLITIRVKCLNELTSLFATLSQKGGAHLFFCKHGINPMGGLPLLSQGEHKSPT